MDPRVCTTTRVSRNPPGSWNLLSGAFTNRSRLEPDNLAGKTYLKGTRKTALSTAPRHHTIRSKSYPNCRASSIIVKHVDPKPSLQQTWSGQPRARPASCGWAPSALSWPGLTNLPGLQQLDGTGRRKAYMTPAPLKPEQLSILKSCKLPIS